MKWAFPKPSSSAPRARIPWPPLVAMLVALVDLAVVILQGKSNATMLARLSPQAFESAMQRVLNDCADIEQQVYRDMKQLDLPSPQRIRPEPTPSLLPGELSLEGIMYDPVRPLAIINGQVKAPGQAVNGYTLDSIEPRKVILSNSVGMKKELLLYRQPSAIQPSQPPDLRTRSP